MSFYNKTKITVVLYAVIAFLLAVLVTGNYFAISYRGLVSQFFGQKTYELVETGEEGEQDTNYYPSAYTDIYDLIEDETAYAKRVQGEGVVLLQNSGLPLSGNETVTLLGKYSKDDCFRNSGSGSGNADTSRAGTIREGFASAGFALNMDMLAYYDGVSTTAEEPAADTLPAFDSEVGVVFISRGGAEGLDVDIEALTLTDTEKGIIDASLANCDETVVLLNTFNPVECGYLEGKDLSVMWIGAAGELGIGVVPQVLKGDINPSGKLVDTYAYDLTDRKSVV